MKQRFLHRVKVSSCAMLAGAVLGQVGLAASAQEATAPQGQPTIPLATFMDINVIAPDDQVRRIVGELLAEAEDSGSAAYARGKTVDYLSLNDAINRALRKNLTLAITQKGIPAAEEALLEADAVFDPSFTVSVGYTRNNVSERRIVGTVREKNFVPFFADKGFVAIPVNPFNPNPQVDGIQFVQKIGKGLVQKPVEVSKRSVNDPPQQTDYTVSVLQQLPWGVAFDVTLNMIDKRVFYNTRGNSYGANWTANVSGNLTLPLPYTKNFGPYADADLGIKLAAKATEASFWQLKQVINNIMGSTDAAYWSVVAALEKLRATDDNRLLIKTQAEATDRLFTAKRVTAFDKAQVDAELARLEEQEESDRNNMIVAANALASLISDSGNDIGPVLVVPAAYRDYLQKYLDLENTDAFANGLAYRPELNSAEVSIDTAQINRYAAAIGTLPDINFFASGSASQKNTGPTGPETGFGYEGPEDALANIITNPDAFSYTTTLQFIRPWGNRSLKAGLRIARFTHEDSKLNLRERQNQVRREVADAMSNVYTARQRVELARKNLEFALAAFEKLIRRREKVGDVTALEIVTTSKSVLEARSELVIATVSHKQAEGALLAAQGIIANQYALNLARTDFERNRIGTLAANDALRYFVPVAE